MALAWRNEDRAYPVAMQPREHPSILDPGLVAAYRRTRYRVHAHPPFTLRVDRPHARLAALLAAQGGRGAAYVSACNPRGVEQDAATNAARHARLLQDLQARGAVWIDAFGAWPDRSGRGERSVLVLDIGRHEALALGRRHEQNAVLWAGADAVPRLLLLR